MGRRSHLQRAQSKQSAVAGASVRPGCGIQWEYDMVALPSGTGQPSPGGIARNAHALSSLAPSTQPAKSACLMLCRSGKKARGPWLP